METISSLITVPLKKLSLSGVNVRKSNREEDIEGLALDILERGLDQNLIVIPGDEAGRYEVVAGGRRYLALRRLQADRRLAATFPVPVKLIEPENGRAASLAENIQRVAMNPADEILAFAEIVADHADETDPLAYCARRTGRSRDVVAQRLRLAALPAQILDALRAGKIGLNAATAYASVADPELQLQIFRNEDARQFGEKHKPGTIRDALKMRTLSATCPQARYVGVDAYLAAGGRLDRDLFMGADVGEQLLDTGLLLDLARQKAEAELPTCLARDGFGQGALTKNLAYPAGEWPKTPAGFTNVFQRADMPDAERLQSIGVYALSSADPDGLMLIGCQKPVRLAVPSASKPASPMAPEETRSRAAPALPQEAFLPTKFSDEERSLSSMDVAYRVQALRLSAAHIAVERVVGPAFGDKVSWPTEPILAPIEDDLANDQLVVAVLVRISRTELEAAMPEAEAQLETNVSAATIEEAA